MIFFIDHDQELIYLLGTAATASRLQKIDGEKKKALLYEAKVKRCTRASKMLLSISVGHNTGLGLDTVGCYALHCWEGLPSPLEPGTSLYPTRDG